MFSISNLTVTEKSHVVLEKFNLSVSEGSITAVIGRFKADIDAIWGLFNESSTMLIQGSITFDGHTYFDRSFLKNSSIKLVSSGEMLLPDFSVLENVFFLDSRLYLPKHRKTKVKELSDLFDKFSIAIAPNTCMATLNRSESLIIELLKTYVNSPKVCVLRDTLSRLSDEYQKIAIDIIRSMQKEAKTSIIYLTTRYEDALKIAEDLVVVSDRLTKGRFSVAEVADNPKPLLYCISGWTDFDLMEDNNLKNMISLLLQMHNSVETTAKFKKALEILVDSIKKVMHADSCSVLVLGEGIQTAITVGDEQIFTNEILKKVNLRDSQSAFDILLCQASPYWGGKEKLHHIFSVPVTSGQELAGLIVVGYEKEQVGIRQKYRILENFAREMAITIETSRLIGKSVLLQESHHRIKNNLQIITNLLFMQKTKFLDMNSEVQVAFDQIINQVKSIALIHDLLSKDKVGNNEVNLRVIIQRIVQFYQNERLEFNLDVFNISIPYNKATTIALVINELIANCVKHAFTNRTKGQIAIKCSIDDERLIIIVHDNGIGFPQDQSVSKLGIGTSIVDTTVLKLGGEIVRSNEKGACVKIMFSRDSIYE